MHFVRGIIKDSVLAAPTTAAPPPPPPPPPPPTVGSPLVPPPAPTHPEYHGKRVDVDGHAYSFEEFLAYHGDEAITIDHWNRSQPRSWKATFQKSVNSVVAVNR